MGGGEGVGKGRGRGGVPLSCRRGFSGAGGVQRGLGRRGGLGAMGGLWSLVGGQ